MRAALVKSLRHSGLTRTRPRTPAPRTRSNASAIRFSPSTVPPSGPGRWRRAERGDDLAEFVGRVADGVPDGEFLEQRRDGLDGGRLGAGTGNDEAAPWPQRRLAGLHKLGTSDAFDDDVVSPRFGVATQPRAHRSRPSNSPSCAAARRDRHRDAGAALARRPDEGGQTDTARADDEHVVARTDLARCAHRATRRRMVPPTPSRPRACLRAVRSSGVRERRRTRRIRPPGPSRCSSPAGSAIPGLLDSTGTIRTKSPAAQRHWCPHASRPVSDPTATTSPPSSWPITIPAGAKGWALMSDPHTPHAATRMTNWSGPGVGSGSSTTSKPCSFGCDGRLHCLSPSSSMSNTDRYSSKIGFQVGAGHAGPVQRVRRDPVAVLRMSVEPVEHRLLG